MSLGDRIKLRREEMRLAANELARRAEISKGYLSEIESGGAPRPSGAVLFRIADALGTSIADLLDKEITPVTGEISPALSAFADQANLPDGDVHMLAQIKFRGEQPKTVDDWRYLYESIRRSIVTGP